MTSLVRCAGAALALVLTSGACASSAASSSNGNASRTVSADPQVTRGLEQLRAATRRFHVLDSAVAAGYPREVRDCLVHEHHGAMGYHHVNQSYMDARAEIERPEILLYERLADGRYRLNGVEFIVPYRFWPRDTIAPTIMGQNMKHEDNLKFWYLHTWAWTPNPDGPFADFHPDVACPANAKVFKPYVEPPPEIHERGAPA